MKTNEMIFHFRTSRKIDQKGEKGESLRTFTTCIPKNVLVSVTGRGMVMKPVLTPIWPYSNPRKCNMSMPNAVQKCPSRQVVN